MAKLTERQKRFVRARATTGDNTKAAKIAGYKHPKEEGYRLTHAHRFKHVQEAIEEQNKKLDEDAGATRAHKRKHLKTIMDKEKQDPRIVISAISEDNKMTGDQIQHNKNEDVTKRPLKDRMYGAIQQILKDPEGRKMIKEAAEGLGASDACRVCGFTREERIRLDKSQDVRCPDCGPVT